MKTAFSPLQPRSPRRGFTLIEVLMVIAILSILMAFLLPAIMGASRAARIAQVKAEIGNLSAAIATFKQEFGIEPPSSITICEEAADWNLPENLRSRALISRMWPQYDFSTNWDLNENGNATDNPYPLNGAECLVFFLGGPTNLTEGAIGFSRNPAMPFSTTAGNRMNPFYQFSIDRLIDIDTNGFPEYRDPLNAPVVSPYVYFSSYEGSGYPTEMNGSVWRNTDNVDTNTPPRLPPRAYYTTITGDAAANVATSRPYNPNGFQLISAGFDGQLGYGGVYDPQATTPFPLWGTLTLLDRDVERDNITNFSNGPLAP